MSYVVFSVRWLICNRRHPEYMHMYGVHVGSTPSSQRQRKMILVAENNQIAGDIGIT